MQTSLYHFIEICSSLSPPRFLSVPSCPDVYHGTNETFLLPSQFKPFLTKDFIFIVRGGGKKKEKIIILWNFLRSFKSQSESQALSSHSLCGVAEQ